MTRREYEIVEAVATGYVSGGLVVRAKELVRVRQEARTRRLAKSLPRRKAEAETEATKAARWVLIKAAVARRVDAERQGRCEWDCPQRAEDPHHVLGGSGRRRVVEHPSNVAGVCRACHRGYEKADLEVLRRGHRWAVDHAFTDAAREIGRRIAKVESTAEMLSARRA